MQPLITTRRGEGEMVATRLSSNTLLRGQGILGLVMDGRNRKLGIL